jgi:hypothetical protein
VALYFGYLRLWPIVNLKALKNEFGEVLLSGWNRALTHEAVFIPFRPIADHHHHSRCAENGVIQYVCYSAWVFFQVQC